MYSAILWCTQTHCALQHSPTFSKFHKHNAYNYDNQQCIIYKYSAIWETAIRKERKKYLTEIRDSGKTQPHTHLVAHSFKSCCAGWESSSCTSAGPRQRRSASGCTRAGVAMYPTSPCSSASCHAALWPRCWSACRTTTPFKVSITTSRSACRTTTPFKVDGQFKVSVQDHNPFEGHWPVQGQRAGPQPLSRSLAISRSVCRTAPFKVSLPVQGQHAGPQPPFKVNGQFKVSKQDHNPFQGQYNHFKVSMQDHNPFQGQYNHFKVSMQDHNPFQCQ